MLRRLSLRDFVIVTQLDVDLADGFSVLTGETGAGKSILIDALQLVLGNRADAGVVREGSARAEISAEFDTPPTLRHWLSEAGFHSEDDESPLLLRRVIDAQGKSRAWINGSAATASQLREAADHLVDIHGQHAWQSLTRPASVRALLDAYAAANPQPVSTAFSQWKAASEALLQARTQQADLERERERLSWQIGEVAKLAPGDDEWEQLNADHQRLSNAQSLIDAARVSLDALSESETNALSLNDLALDKLQDVAEFDPRLAAVSDLLHGVQAQLKDAAHTLTSYLSHTELDPQGLEALDERLAAWMGLARRYRRPPAELPAVLAQWREELHRLDAAADLNALEAAELAAKKAYHHEARALSTQRQAAAPKLSQAITQAMQHLGMAGGRFAVSLVPQESPQAYGLEGVEFLVAGHEGSTPRPLGKVASGGELSRIALAIAVTTSQAASLQSGAVASTLIFDEVDSGVGGAVADTVGRLMKQLGRERQVMAVTHLPQVAACADHHFVVSKVTRDARTHSDVRAVQGEERVGEVARMLGGERQSGTTLAHAQELLTIAAETPDPAPAPATRARRR